MIIASVVLPSPGGPDSSTWSGARPRRRAASSTRPSWSRTRVWPTTSSRLRGRSAASTARSSPSASSAVRDARCDVLGDVEVVLVEGHAITPSTGCGGRRAAATPTSGASPACVGDGVDRLLGVLGVVAEADQALVHLVAPRRRRRDRERRPRAGGSADPVLELEDDPLGALLADAGHLGQRLDVLGGDRAAQVVGREHGEHRLGELRADAGRGLDELEDRSSRRRRRSRRGSASPRGRPCWSAAWPRAGAQRGQRAGRAHELEADAADLEDRAGQGDGGDPPRTNAIIGDCLLAASRRPAASIRAWAPPRQMWVMASASASAASAGLGVASRRRIRVTIAPTCALSARPLPETAALTSLGVCSATGSPRRAAQTMAMPLAWAVPMTVLTSERAKTRSTATASGRCSSSQASMPRSIVTSRSGTGRCGGRAEDVDVDQPSAGARGSPRPRPCRSGSGRDRSRARASVSLPRPNICSQAKR